MDYANTPARPRRLIRRLIPWTLALGLFAGGGYGVYHFAAPTSDELAEDKAPIVDPFVANGDDAPAERSEQLRQQLFSNEPPTAVLETPRTPPADRYAQAAPQLPPAAEDDPAVMPRSAAAVTPMDNPFAAPASPPIGRYVEPAVQYSPATEQPAADAPDSMPSESQPVEIARGQEPTSGNPLRAASATSPAAEPQDHPQAREAFADAAPLPAYLAEQPTAQDQVSDAPSATQTPAPVNAAPPANPFSRYNAPAAQTAAPASAASMFGNQSTGGPTTAAAEPVPADVAPPTAAEPTLADPPAQPLSAAVARQPRAPASAGSALAEPAAETHFSASAEPAEMSVTPTPGVVAVEGAGQPGERSLEGAQNPGLTIQKLAPAEIQVGKKCTFAIKIQNNSQRTAHNVQVRDEIPRGAQFVGSAPKANVAGAEVVWDLGSIPHGEERIVEMELLPTTEGEIGSVATVTFAAQASARSRCTRPELALRLSTAPQVMVGGQVVIAIEVSNPGSGDATGVMILETVPPGVRHEAGPALEFEVGTLKAGETRPLELVLTAEQAGRINNVVTARADANLEAQANCEFEIIAPQLAVSVDGPGRRYLERPATYTITIDNPGTAPAKEVQLITKLPPGMRFVEANNYGEYDAATHSVHWSLAELPANPGGGAERGTVQLTALPVEAGEHTLEVASRAEQGLEDRTEARTVVEGLVALSFDVDPVDGAIEVGGQTAYDVTVVNQGSKAAANVQVVAVIPQGMRAVAGQGASQHVVQGDRVVFAPIPQLAPKAEAKFRVEVQGLQAGDQRTRIMVTADEVQEPITKEESTRVYADQ